jgi:hypothetical protein
MRNAILIFPLLAFEWEKKKGSIYTFKYNRVITIGWLRYTYSFKFK